MENDSPLTDAVSTAEIVACHAIYTQRNQIFQLIKHGKTANLSW